MKGTAEGIRCLTAEMRDVAWAVATVEDSSAEDEHMAIQVGQSTAVVFAELSVSLPRLF